jgi:hypothetical protein
VYKAETYIRASVTAESMQLVSSVKSIIVNTAHMEPKVKTLWQKWILSSLLEVCMQNSCRTICPTNSNSSRTKLFLVRLVRQLRANFEPCLRIRTKIKSWLFPLYLPTQQNGPYSTHFICQFQIKILFCSFCTKKEQKILSYFITFTYTFY